MIEAIDVARGLGETVLLRATSSEKFLGPAGIGAEGMGVGRGRGARVAAGTVSGFRERVVGSLVAADLFLLGVFWVIVLSGGGGGANAVRIVFRFAGGLRAKPGIMSFLVSGGAGGIES